MGMLPLCHKRATDINKRVDKNHIKHTQGKYVRMPLLASQDARQPPSGDWGTSAVKMLLASDIADGKVSKEDRWQDVYNSRPEYMNTPRSRFSARLKSLFKQFENGTAPTHASAAQRPPPPVAFGPATLQETLEKHLSDYCEANDKFTSDYEKLVSDHLEALEKVGSQEAWEKVVSDHQEAAKKLRNDWERRTRNGELVFAESVLPGFTFWFNTITAEREARGARWALVAALEAARDAARRT